MISRGTLAAIGALLGLLLLVPAAGAQDAPSAALQVEIQAPDDERWAGESVYVASDRPLGGQVPGGFVALDEARRFSNVVPARLGLTLRSIPDGLRLDSVACDFADDVDPAPENGDVRLTLRPETLTHCTFVLAQEPVRVRVRSWLPSGVASEGITVKLEGLSGQWRVGTPGFTDAETSLGVPRALEVVESPLAPDWITCHAGDLDDADYADGGRIELQAEPGDQLECDIHFPRTWTSWRVEAPADRAGVSVDLSNTRRSWMVGADPLTTTLAPGPQSLFVRWVPAGLSVDDVSCDSTLRTRETTPKPVEHATYSRGTASIRFDGAPDERIECRIKLVDAASLTMAVELPDGSESAWEDVLVGLESPDGRRTLQGLPDGEPVTYQSVPEGSHRIEGLLPAPLEVVRVVCEQPGTVTTAWRSAAATIYLEPGTERTCTFVAASSDIAVGVEWPAAAADASVVVGDVIGEETLVGAATRTVSIQPGAYSATVRPTDPEVVISDVVCAEESLGVLEPRDVVLERIDGGVGFRVDALLFDDIRCTVSIFDDELETAAKSDSEVGSTTDQAGPKEEPDDAAIAIVPKEGRWRAVSPVGTATCGGRSFELPRQVNEVIVEMRRRGTRFVGTPTGRNGTRVVADADPDEVGRYVGKLRTRIQGASVSMDTVLQVVNEERIVGNATIVTRIAGQRCVASQDLVMTRKGK